MTISAKQNLYNKMGVKKIDEVSSIKNYKNEQVEEKYSIDDVKRLITESLNKSITTIKSELLSEFEQHFSRNITYIQNLIESQLNFSKKEIDFHIKSSLLEELKQFDKIKEDINIELNTLIQKELEKFNSELNTETSNIKREVNNVILSTYDDFLLNLSNNKDLTLKEIFDLFETKKNDLSESFKNIFQTNIELFENNIKEISTKQNIDFTHTIINFLKEFNNDFFNKLQEKIDSIEKEFDNNIQKLLENKIEYYSNIEIPTLFSQRLKEVDNKIQSITNTNLEELKIEYKKISENLDKSISEVNFKIKSITEELFEQINIELKNRERDFDVNIKNIETNYLNSINEHVENGINKISEYEKNTERKINEKMKILNETIEKVNNIDIESFIKENIENFKKEQQILVENYYSNLEYELNTVKNKDFSFDYELNDGKLRFIVNGNETDWIDIKDMIKKYSPKKSSMSSDFVSGGGNNNNIDINTIVNSNVFINNLVDKLKTDEDFINSLTGIVKISERFVIQNDNTTLITTNFEIQPNSESVYLNGIKLKNGVNEDYVVIDNQILFNFSLYRNDIVEIVYVKL